MTTLSVTAERRPVVIGVVSTVCLHVLVLVAFTMIYLDVAPMTTPPLEVELMGGYAASEMPSSSQLDESVSPSERLLPTTRSEPIPASRRISETEEPIPDLPEATSGGLETLSPPQILPTPARRLRSPSQELSPLPVSTADTTAQSQSRVQVHVEGMLRARRLVHMVSPVFPREGHGGGVVKIRLSVDGDGTVTSATVIQKAHPALERAAVDAIKQWRFAASETSGASQGIVTVDFVVQ